MKIIRLQTQGFKRVVALDVTPDTPVVEVRGNNAEGKTSLLDSIMAALGGADAAPLKPIRTGEDFAAIRIELGDGEPSIIVEKYFDEVGEKLRVTNGDGAEYRQSQTTIDNLLGRMTFDPLAFARMDPKAQAVELRRLVPLKVDLDELARADAADTLARRDVNREGKAVIARRDAINFSGTVPPRPDRAAIVAALGGAADANTAIERERFRRDDQARQAANCEQLAENAAKEAERLREASNRADAASAEQDAEAKRIKAELAALPPLGGLVDTAKLSTDLAQADADLALLGRIDERSRLDSEVTALRTRSEAFTTAIGDRAKLRASALAEAAFPVPGLSFGKVHDDDSDLVVMFEGEPFAQASGAQQLRVSMALAMAANPKLRVMLIRDGSLLDQNGLALVRELAGARDYQVWLESVGEGDGTGLIMEAGTVRGAPEPEKMQPPRRRKAKAEGEGADAPAQAEADPAALPPRRKPSDVRKAGDLFGGGQ